MSVYIVTQEILIWFFNMGHSLKLGTTCLVKILCECVVYVKNDAIDVCLFSTLHGTYFPIIIHSKTIILNGKKAHLASQRYLEF